MHKISLAAVLLLSVVVGINAQVKNGKVRATVLDANNFALMGLEIILTNMDTRATQKCVSNELGECNFEAPSGTYQLSSELLGACILKVSDVRIKENETMPVERKLSSNVIWATRSNKPC